jgi:hypothetical protein
MARRILWWRIIRFTRRFLHIRNNAPSKWPIRRLLNSTLEQSIAAALIKRVTTGNIHRCRDSDLSRYSSQAE